MNGFPFSNSIRKFMICVFGERGMAGISMYSLFPLDYTSCVFH